MNPYARIFIVVLSIFAGTMIAYGQTKTYTNTRYDFSFKYPSSWVKDSDTDIVVNGMVASHSIHFLDKATRSELLVSYTLAKGQEIYQSYAADLTRGKRITVGGNEAIALSISNNRNGKGVLLKKKDQSQEINVEFKDNKGTGEFELKFDAMAGAAQAGELNKFNRLVSSFKFLK